MIIEEPRYWLAIIPFSIFVYIFYRLLKKIFSETPGQDSVHLVTKIALSVIFIGLILIGIRGRLEEKSPIRVGTAYFSNNAFLNQLGLNPNFTFLRSYLDSRKEENKAINLMENARAVAIVQNQLNIKSPDPDFPLLRKIVPDSANASHPNVVVVIMESMSAAKLDRHGNGNHLTPFLDSISKRGYYFENAYTSGIHTFNGIFSALKDNGYSTIYFATHDGQFDNVEGFLKANDCDTVIAKPDYPASKIKTTLGVPDDFMFEFSIPIIH